MELELKTNTEIARRIDTLSELHRRVVTEGRK